MGMKEFAEYLILKNLNKSSIKQYLTYYRLFEKVIGEGEITQEIVNDFMLRHTSNLTRAFLRNLFDFYDLKDFKLPKITGRRKSKKRKSLSAQDIKVLRSWLFNNRMDRYLLLFDLSYYGALRRSEALGILVEDFDIESWKNDTAKPCRLKIKGKGDKERFVIVPSSIMLRVIAHIKATPQITMKDRLFPFGVMKWQKAFKTAVKSTMDYNYTLHDLRRSRATRWYDEGKDLTQIKNRLGHKSIATTQLYINPDEEKELKIWEQEYS